MWIDDLLREDVGWRVYDPGNGEWWCFIWDRKTTGYIAVSITTRIFSKEEQPMAMGRYCTDDTYIINRYQQRDVGYDEAERLWAYIHEYPEAALMRMVL